jgi:hypothetical protein
MHRDGRGAVAEGRRRPGGGAPQDDADDGPALPPPTFKTSTTRRDDFSRRRRRRADALTRTERPCAADWSPFQERFTAQGPVVRRARPLDGLAPLSVSQTVVNSPCGEITAGMRTGGAAQARPVPAFGDKGSAELAASCAQSSLARIGLQGASGLQDSQAVVEARSLRRLDAADSTCASRVPVTGVSGRPRRAPSFGSLAYASKLWSTTRCGCPALQWGELEEGSGGPASSHAPVLLLFLHPAPAALPC